MRHVLKGTPGAPCAHGDDDQDRHCHICDGGLALCVVCGGAEGSLPTECPGRPLTAAEEDAIMAGTMDFEGFWRWNPTGLTR
jgi:hypothetical protein